jgi:hypothetical protein
MQSVLRVVDRFGGSTEPARVTYDPPGVAEREGGIGDLLGHVVVNRVPEHMADITARYAHHGAFEYPPGPSISRLSTCRVATDLDQAHPASGA